MQPQQIGSKIYIIKGERIMLDYDLAMLYAVETKTVNQAVKRNLKRFPPDFMFRLTVEEWVDMRSQIVTAYQSKRNTSSTPYAFTEQGVAMLSGILKSDKAINMNIAIMRAFVEVRKVLLIKNDWQEQLNEICERLGEHDVQLNLIYEVMEKLSEEKSIQKDQEQRTKIGFLH